ncbi:MAG: Arc family DNA-binding protein [Oscillospiraceae bacterium]|nr:Arc family DNA-binding protein [Oscillospiraceae bacterium]
MDDKSKKQVPLRLSASLWKELVSWAEDDFRSLNGQIEYLLNECVKRRGRRAAAPSVEGEGAGESES